jgi:hypothetical protein
MKDADGDGYGAIGGASALFESGTDCDDRDAWVGPGFAELDSPTACMKDADGDGYGAIGGASALFESGTDCDDRDAWVGPGFAELDSPTACMKDADDDGYGAIGDDSALFESGTDCDDTSDELPGEDEGCETTCHPYNPVGISGWEKTYLSTFISDVHGTDTALATEQSMGTGYTTSGYEAYKTWETMTVGGSTAWEGSVYHSCDYVEPSGFVSGLSVREWNMNISYSVELEGSPFSPGSVLMILSEPRRYLPDVSLIGTGESWFFDYTLTYVDTSGSGISISLPVSGSYQDHGLEIIDVAGVSMEAWHISSTYSMMLTAMGGFTRDYPSEADYYWVEGLGLVYETHTDTETGAIILSKELTSYSGL